MMSEKFCLKWNDFHSNVSKSFGLFRNEDYLHDVTLVSDDHKQVSAHKLVLLACSEYFKEIFKQNSKPNAHPLICLDGIKSDDLKNIMDYIYDGEVQIFQEHLDHFLSIAQRFKLEGLLENNDGSPKDESVFNAMSNDDRNIADEVSSSYLLQIPNSTYSDEPIVRREVAKEDKVIVPISTEDFSDVENAVNQYIERGTDGIRRCTLCGKPEKNGVLKNLKNHIETHLEGLSFPCQLCGKTFRSRNAYNKHKHYVHKTQFHN